MLNDTPAHAEQTFYGAFERGDIEQMMALWAPQGELLCIHPMGAALRERSLIEASWQEIFGAPNNHHIDIELLSETGNEALTIRSVVENFSNPSRGERFAPILATNIYSRCNGGWYLLTHHASPARHRQTANPTPSETRH